MREYAIAICSVLMITACAKMNFSEIPQNNQTAVNPGSSSNKTINESQVVAYGNKQVDFLLILDDSDSMQTDLNKLAVRMTSFLNSIQASNIDWQMCFVTTRGVATNGTVAFGAPRNWLNYQPPAGAPAYLLKKGATNLDTIFTSTVSALQIGGGLSWDERAIMAAYQNFQSSSANGCYRKGAAVSVIAISNEDERSVGGDKTMLKPSDYPLSYQPLESGDIPENLVAQAKGTFGVDVRFNFNSIIVVPGDKACEALEDQDPSPSHQGVQYLKLSNLTGGAVGSICDSDFSNTLSSVRNIVINSLSEMTLQCSSPAGLKVSINGQDSTDFALDGNILKFKSPLSEGTKVDLSYFCN